MNPEQPERVAYNCETDLSFRDGVIIHLIWPALNQAMEEDGQEGIQGGNLTREVAEETSDEGVRMAYDFFADGEDYVSVSTTAYSEELQLSDEMIELMRQEIAADPTLEKSTKQRLQDNLGDGLSVEFFIRHTFEVDLALVDVTHWISLGYTIEEIEIDGCPKREPFDFEQERETMIGASECPSLVNALLKLDLITDDDVRRFAKNL